MSGCPALKRLPSLPATRLPRTQVPGLGMRLDTTKLDLVYKDEYSNELPDAYERLLMDVVNGGCSACKEEWGAPCARRRCSYAWRSWQKVSGRLRLAPPMAPYWVSRT